MGISLGFSGIRIGASSSSWKSYWTRKSLFFLDGTIILVGSDYYFKDNSSAARNFLITGYDFDSTWTKGFPYKSAATISAPVGDAVLIAADINNFLYDSGGTPNQIPVVSLFQNIDYENTIYCKHTAQVLDGNGVETYEPRVLEIFMTAAALSASDIVKANTYFGVPTEDVNAKWIDPINGVDATGDGSKGTPWKTLSKAEATITDNINQIIYIKTGLCDEATYFKATKNASWKAIGFFKLTGQGVNYVMYFTSTKVCNINGFIIDGTIDRNTVMAVGTDTNNKVINNCMLYGGNTINISVNGVVGSKIVFNNCIFPITTGTSWFNTTRQVEFNGCFVNSTKSGTSNTGTGNFYVQYCKIIYNNSGIFLQCSNASNYTYKINYNTILVTQASRFIQVDAGNSTFEFKHNNLIITSLSLSCVGYSGTGIIEIKNNNIVNNSIKDCFSTGGGSAINISNNFYYSETGNFNVIQSPSIKTSVLIENNYIINKSLSGYGVSVGNETTTAFDNNISGIVIRNNTIFLARYYDVDADNNVHGIFVGFQKDAIVEHNYIFGAGLGIVHKGSTGTTYTSGRTSYNLVVNSTDVGIYSKGVSGVKIINNSIINTTSDNSFTGILLGANTGGDESASITIKNNIIDIKNGLNTSNPYVFNTGCDVGHVIDYNNVYNSTSDKIGSIAYVLSTFTEWQVLGYDVHGINAQVIFNSLSNEQFWPVTPITEGEDLGATYDDGLDASTDWGSDTELPTIVTKQQGAAWDIGAYIH
jgi:proteasome assembly chaperone (PAC2) family protein